MWQCANKYVMYPVEEHLHTVDDVRVVDLLGKFAVNTFNKSCKMVWLHFSTCFQVLRPSPLPAVLLT